ncbi:ribbon-helix-helix domain-containing protein [Patescibacteria group bacterium]|nr:ribbon-helix-helix domain-containing protein [Patescibacteria group bacterium]
MSIVNFAVSKPLEQKINQAIKEYGFASKAEFFRFAAMDLVTKIKHPALNEEEKFAQSAQKLSKTIHQIYGGKKLPSVEEQFADLK